VVVQSTAAARRAKRAAGSAVHPRSRPEAAAPERHRLLVIGPTAAEVVLHAGGWLCDQVLAGWECTVLTLEPGDTRPVRILGATSRLLAQELAAPGRVPQAIAVEVALCGDDPQVRALVRRAIAQGTTEVRRWGDCAADTVHPVHHRVSLAARAFKAHALAATGAAPADPQQLLHESATLAGPDLTEAFRAERPARLAVASSASR
jgi:hypothetical protein